MKEDSENKDYTLELFDLQKALAGEVVCDKDGNEVTQIKEFRGVNTSFSNVGIISNNFVVFNANGVVAYSPSGNASKKLYMKVPKPKPREIWVNEYADGLCGVHHNTRLEAEKEANSIYPKQVKFREVLDEE